MLSVIEATNRRGALLTLTLDDISNGFSVRDVEGLEPVQATLVSTAYADSDGSYHQSERREDRNIRLKLGLEVDYVSQSARELRNTLYQWFMTKTLVSLRFLDTDGLSVNISGRVETFDCPIFTDDPEATISIICNDPDFVDPNPVVVNGMTTSSTTDPAGRLEIVYDGTVESGMEFTLYPDRTLTEFTIYHRTSDTTAPETFDFAAPLEAGDVLKISMVTGSKGLRLTRSGTESSLLRGKSPQSPWLELENGLNYIRFYAEGAAIPFDLTYLNRYGGL